MIIEVLAEASANIETNTTNSSMDRSLSLRVLMMDAALLGAYAEKDLETFDEAVAALPDMQEVRLRFKTAELAEQFRLEGLECKMARLYRTGKLKLGTKEQPQLTYSWKPA